MSPETVVSKRMIKDHMLSFKSSWQRYEIHLEEERKTKQVTKAEKKAMHIVEDIDKLKVKQGQLERAMEMMESEFVECIRLAEDKDDMAYVHTRLGLKRKSTETKDSMKVVEKEIQELQENRESCCSRLLVMFFLIFFLY